MKATFKNAWGYQGDNMNLPVADLDAAVPFYEKIMGFRVESRSHHPGSEATATPPESTPLGDAPAGTPPRAGFCI